jgi:large subunit ribosomal protein L24
MKIKKGDKVKVISGSSRGKTGAVLKVFPETLTVTVEGANMVKKRVRPNKQDQKGEMVSVARPIKVEKVALLCPACAKETRIGYKVTSTTKVRICRKCGAQLS